MKYWPSKSFLISVACLGGLVTALGIEILPELEALRKPPIRGEVRFENPRSVAFSNKPSVPENSGSFGSTDWLESGYEDLMSWDKNPWKKKIPHFGYHYTNLARSKDPIEIARAKELRRLADALHKRLLVRYPELVVAGKNVPPERNGFLKWLELAERLCPPDNRSEVPEGLKFPAELTEHLNENAPWNHATATSWLVLQKPLMDEIRTIGLMPDQSIEGIDVHRWAFINARFAKAGSEALLIEARVAAENGDAAAAINSIQAANGIAAHLGDVETPTLLAITVQILVKMQTQRYAFEEIMPALPPGQLDPVAWENALNPQVSPPDEFARIMRGEWNVIFRACLLPSLLDAEDPKLPSDPDALLDAYAGYFVNVIQNHEGRNLPDWPTLPNSIIPDLSHLSYQSRKIIEHFFIGEQAWRNGMQRSVSAAAVTQAAFAIMKGQPVPNDPIYGQPYRWDPTTRSLSTPDTSVFNDLNIEPIIIPKL